MTSTPTNRVWLFAICAAALFLTALFWAKARDPFRRVNFSLRTGSGKTEGIAVLPKRSAPFPVAIFLHGSGEDILKDGSALRLIAEQGLAAVSFEYDKTNQANFDTQLDAMHRFLSRQPWARSNAVAWIAQSLGAQRSLSSLLRYPELQPQVMVRLNGGWVDEPGRESEVRNPKSEIRSPKRPFESITPDPTPFIVWLVHGELDETFRATDCQRVASLLQTNGASVQLTIFPRRPHSFGEDQPVLIRAAAEFCARNLGGNSPLRINVRPALWWCWLPASLICLAAAGLVLRPLFREWTTRGNRMLKVLAIVLAVLAVTDSALHLVPPQLSPSPRALAFTRALLVRPESRPDFDWLTQQPGAANQKIGTLLQHLELSALQRRFKSELNAQDDRNFVLSPWIGRDENEVRWRRMLWEAFYPRIRDETDSESAARIVGRFLRERVTISGKAAPHRSVAEIWSSGYADADGFERVYVAALRSVGIAARLDAGHKAEFFLDRQWQAAPRPLFEAVPE